MRKRGFILLVLILIVLDQLSKFLVMSNMELYERIPIIKEFFSFFYIRNNGAAFSLFSGKTYLFYIVTIVALYIGYKMFRTSTTKLSLVASSLLIAGILGNFIDRIRFKEVIDFLSFKFGSYEFAIFNVADTYITFAVILFILDYFINERGKKEDVRYEEDNS